MHFYSEALGDVQITETHDTAEVMDGKSVRDNNIRTYAGQDGSATVVSLAWTSSSDIHAILLLRQGSGNWIVNGDPENVMTAEYQRVLLDFTGPSPLRITVPSGGKLYEVYFLMNAFSMAKPDERPMRYRRGLTDPGGSAYHSESSEVISYAGLAPGGKGIILVGWDHLDRLEAKPVPDPSNPGMNIPGEFTTAPRDELSKFERLFLGPPIRKPFFFYPEPTRRPREAFRVYWANDFTPVPTEATLAAGYTLNLELHET